MDYSASGPSPVDRNLTGTARVRLSSASSSVVELTVPAAGIDTRIAIPGNFATGGLSSGSGGVGYALSSGLSYVAFGLWEQPSSVVPPGTAMAYAFGYETPASAMPTTGSASYTGIGKVLARVFFVDSTGAWSPTTKGQLVATDLHGNAQLNVNFATGLIDGQFSLQGDVWNNGFDAPWNDVTVSASIVPGTNRLSGTTGTTTPAPLHQSPAALPGTATGFIDGGFYGPAAENLGATWSLGAGGAMAIGVVGAER